MNPNEHSMLDTPFFDDNYTFGDRLRDLALIETLLADKLNSIRMERALLHHTLKGVPAANPEQPSVAGSRSSTAVDADPTLPQPGDD